MRGPPAYRATSTSPSHDQRGIGTPGGAGVPLLIVGCPMGADGFAALAGLLPERPVVTYDPRGVGRSTRADGAGEITPDEHAGDLAGEDMRRTCQRGGLGPGMSSRAEPPKE